MGLVSQLAAVAAEEEAQSGGGGFFGVIMWPFRALVEVLLVGWHWLFTAVGLQADAGLTWVLSIVGLVIVIRLGVFPLFVRQIRSQRKMMELAPQMRKIQEKYKGKKDQLSREAMSRETMALYKKHGTTPMSSCLPLLVQMPFLLGMFYTLLDIKKHAEAGIGGVTSVFNAELTKQFYDAKLFGVAPLHSSLTDIINAEVKPDGWQATVTILIVLVVCMIGSQFFTQLQLISKNLSPEAKTGQAYQMQKIMLYVLPLGFIFSGVFFPLGVVMYWFVSNLWTMGQQFLVIREMPTPGSEAAKAREERLAKRGKAINKAGKVVSMAEFEREQEELRLEAEKAKKEAAKRQQPMSSKRAKSQQKNKQGGPQNKSQGNQQNKAPKNQQEQKKGDES